jgi:hypothetical protein
VIRKLALVEYDSYFSMLYYKYIYYMENVYSIIIPRVVKDCRMFLWWYHGWSFALWTPWVRSTNGVQKRNDHKWYHRKNILLSLTTSCIQQTIQWTKSMIKIKIFKASSQICVTHDFIVQLTSSESNNFFE